MIYSPRRPYLSTYFPFWKHNLKKKKVFLGLGMQPLAKCELKTFWPEGWYSVFKGLFGCSFWQSQHFSGLKCFFRDLSAIDDEESEVLKAPVKSSKQRVNGSNFGQTARSFWIFTLYLLNIHLYPDNYVLVSGACNYWTLLGVLLTFCDKWCSIYCMSVPWSLGAS